MCDKGECPECAEAGTATISLQVMDNDLSCNQESMEFEVSWSLCEDDPGCPIFERSEVGQWKELNTILSQSAYDSSAVEIEDYYGFPEAPGLSMNPLEFRIKETTAGECTTIDFVELWMADHAPELTAVVTNAGDLLWGHERDTLLTAHLLDGPGVTEFISDEDDSLYIAFGEGDTVVCIFDDVISEPTIGLLTVRAKEKPYLMEMTSEEGGLRLRVEGAPEEGSIYPRRDWYTDVAGSPGVQRGDGIQDTVVICVHEHHWVDYVGLVPEDDSSPSYTVIPLNNAIHSSQGNVTSRLAAVDSLDVSVLPGESILLGFPRPFLPPGQERDLVLRSRGGYRLVEWGSRPVHDVARWGLLNAWPNPSREGLSLLYSSNGGEVAFSIFDVGGRLVRTIEYPGLAPGKHVAIWDGLTNGGKRAGTGIYFVLLEEGGKKDTSKVVLLR